jgi:hypothetical protein
VRKPQKREDHLETRTIIGFFFAIPYLVRQIGTGQFGDLKKLKK